MSKSEIKGRSLEKAHVELLCLAGGSQYRWQKLRGARWHLKFGRGRLRLGCVGFLLWCAFGQVGKRGEGLKIRTPAFKPLLCLKYHH